MMMHGRKHIVLVAILLIAFLLRMYVLITNGVSFSIHSDDIGYLRSAQTLLLTGTLTYHRSDEPTVHIMPGMPIFLAAVFAVFGHGFLGLLAAKVAIIAIGVLGVYGVYRIGRTVWGHGVGLLAALLMAVYPPLLVVDNLLLTETPFMTALIFFVYYSIRLSRTRTWRDLLAVVVAYLIALYFRPTIALAPICLLPLLLFKRYPLRLLTKQAIGAALIVVLALAPWWIRNYLQFGAFIPLTGSAGNPLLLGTYQGEGYPDTVTLDEWVNVLMRVYPSQDAYTKMKVQEAVAKYRLRQWWKHDKTSLLYSYAVLKPKILWRKPFYPKEVLGISYVQLHAVHRYIVGAAVAGYALALWRRQGRHEGAFVSLVLLYFTAVYSLYFAYERYALPLMPLCFLGMAAGLLPFLVRRNSDTRCTL